jgi:RimJ/RimL family protein N-acetyltransferase
MISRLLVPKRQTQTTSFNIKNNPGGFDMSYYTLKGGIEVNIRKAEERDAKEIVDMFNVMGGESENLTFGYNDYYLNENQEKLFIKAMRERCNSLFIVAVIDCRIVGYLTFTTMQKGKITHRGDMGIAVFKEYWGLGIGSLLIEYFMNWAEFNGNISKVELQVREDNKRGVDLYLKWGFEIEGKISRGMKIDDTYYDLYYMGKRIGR